MRTFSSIILNCIYLFKHSLISNVILEILETHTCKQLHLLAVYKYRFILFSSISLAFSLSRFLAHTLTHTPALAYRQHYVRSNIWSLSMGRFVSVVGSDSVSWWLFASSLVGLLSVFAPFVLIVLTFKLINWVVH